MKKTFLFSLVFVFANLFCTDSSTNPSTPKPKSNLLPPKIEEYSEFSYQSINGRSVITARVKMDGHLYIMIGQEDFSGFIHDPKCSCQK